MTTPSNHARMEDLLRELRELRTLVEGLRDAILIFDPHRAYSDHEVCALLGGISRSTLWRIRHTGNLEPVELLPASDGRAGGVRRTTGRQIIDYLVQREQAVDVLNFTGTGRKRKWKD